MLHEVDEVGLEELGPDLVHRELLEEEEENVESDLRHVPHGVFERPHNGVHQQLELCRRDLHQRYTHTHQKGETKTQLKKIIYVSSF